MRNLLKKIVLSTLSVSCIASAVGGALSLDGALQTKASEECVSSAAYFLNEDRSTQGLWYNGEHGTKGDPESDRNYGVDGCILFYHWLRVDGQPIKDVEILSDFSYDTNVYKNNERANYNEIPEYIESVTGDLSNGYLNYWINGNGTDIEKEWTSTYAKHLLLPVEGGYDTEGNLVHYGQGGFGTVSNGAANIYTVQAKDNEWHDVSLYVGSSVFHKYPGYDEHTMGIYDLNDKLLAEYVVKDPAIGTYLKFAVKGSYKIKYQTTTYSSAGYNYGLFFDPHEENEEIGTSNLTAALEGAKVVNLAWTNASDESFTTIYRRVKGEKTWQYLDCVEKGVNIYRDESSVVAKTYEYALSSGTEKKTKSWHDRYEKECTVKPYTNPSVCVKYSNLPDEEGMAECSTAAYKPTKIEFLDESYLAQREGAFQVRAKLTKSDDNGVTFVPYEGIEVSFTLQGDAVESDLGMNVYPNMDKTFATGTTNADGIVAVEGSIAYEGTYEIVASIDLQPDSDPMYGYDASSSVVLVTVQDNIATKNTLPVITAISDAIKPGDTVTISGLNLLSDSSLKIAYIKNDGDEPSAYNENAAYKNIDQKDILVAENVNGTGITFVFPKSAAAGMYDFYVHTNSGWSNGITMNAPRPQYIDQEAAYEGQQIQIVGRNFLLSEYGAANSEKALQSLKVKLSLIADKNGNPASGLSKTLTQKNGGILTTLKETKESAMQFESDVLEAEDIPYTYELRITFVVPSVLEYGTYEVSVSSDGKYFSALSEPCALKIIEKKAQNWNETVFGVDKSAAVGNDPLGLGAYWVQDFNYTNVVTMQENTFETAVEYTKELNNQMSKLSSQGGGVVYFPEGNYYLYADVYMHEGIILVGAGTDKTTVHYANADGYNTVWFRAKSLASNIGIARMTLDVTGDDCSKGEDGYYSPNFLMNWGFTGDYGGDIEYSDTQNKFLIDVDVDGVMDNLANNLMCRQYLLICANKNVIWKNLDVVGGQIYTRADKYVTCYNVYQVFNGKSSSSPPMQSRYAFIENSYIDQNYCGHGISIRSNTYCAYSYVAHAGNRVDRSNQGEAILCEPPSGQIATGKVLAADNRSVTLDFSGGKKVDKDTLLHYNRFAVYISDGTGAGQMRYIDRNGSGDYANCYSLLEYERDWDVLPDTTSVFYISSPNSNLTISHFKAYDTAGTICLYGNVHDVVVADCKLVDTAGIGVWGITVGGMRGARVDASTNIRIERNDISGVSAHYDVGSVNAQGVGGIFVSYAKGDYMGMLISDITIRDNYLHDLMPNVSSIGENGWLNGTGITLYSGVTQGQGNPNVARNIGVENNVVTDSEYGIYVDRLANGIVIKNNSVSNTSMFKDNMQVYRPNNFVSEAYHELIVDGKVSSLSGNYSLGEILPNAPDSGDKVFFGWTTDENYTPSSPIVNSAYGVNSKLYAVYGYKVVFDYNYVKSDGTQKGEYVTLKALPGGNVSAELNSYGDPFRLNDEFLGWYIDKECTVAFDSTAALNGNVTVYAKWSSAANANVGDNTGEQTKKGCKGSVAVSTAAVMSIVLVAAAIAVIGKRKQS